MTNILLKEKDRNLFIEKPTKIALAKRLGISRGMLYYHYKRPALDEEIKRQIESTLSKYPSYGHKRIAIELKLNKKRIRRIMKKFNIKPYRRRCKKPVKKEDMGKAEEDEINIYKLLCPIYPNVIWVSDFTYIKYQGKFIYLATVMDMYTREIIGISISRFHNTNLVMEAFINALSKTNTKPIYLHSDQGSEYTSEEYKVYVMEKQIIISFSDKGSPWQNGYQESFYQGFKLDLGDVSRLEVIGELIEAIHKTMYYYNNCRIHTALKTNPVLFKKSFLNSRDKLFKELGT